jgi:steroid delta-isomerase-like uncharacterized protein
MSATNKDVVRRLYKEVWNERKLEVVDEVISKSHALSGPTFSGTAIGPAAYKTQVQQFITGLPDLRFHVEDCICEKDKVVTSWTVSGTHKGDLFGVAPTNKKISFSGITIHQLSNGRILDSQAMWDALGLMGQIGVAAPGKPVTRAAVNH